MRSIEFRGKALREYKKIKAGDWIHGNFAYQEFTVTREKKMVRIIPKTMTWDPIEVDPETVGQYTGLKDKNGVKIFEGDIITHLKWEERANYPIVWDDNEARFCIDVTQTMKQPFEDHHYFPLIGSHINVLQIVVISNIHDNPELLEVQK